MKLDDLLKEVQPDRPRQRVSIPIALWLTEYAKDGYINIPIYMSVKAKENPDGYKWSAVRKILSNGHINLHEKINKMIKELFSEAFYTITKDRETDHRFALVVPASQVSAMRKRNYHMKPIVEALGDAVTTPVKIVTEPLEDKTQAGKIEKEVTKVVTPTKENIPKSKKNKKK